MYGKMYKTESRTTTLSFAVSDAFSEFDMLADEMAEVREALEERFSQTSRYEQVEETAGKLDEHRDAPNVPDFLEELQVSFAIGIPKPKRYVASRMSRCGNAINMLNAVVELLNEFADDEEANQEVARDAARELADELQQAIDDIDSLEFPGMRG